MCLRAASGRTRSPIPSSNRMRLQSSANDSGAKPWREHKDSATGPERESHTPRGGGVALAMRIALTWLSSPVTVRITESGFR